MKAFVAMNIFQFFHAFQAKRSIITFKEKKLNLPMQIYLCLSFWISKKNYYFFAYFFTPSIQDISSLLKI